MSELDYNRIRKMPLIEFIKLPRQQRAIVIAKQPQWLETLLNRLIIQYG